MNNSKLSLSLSGLCLVVLGIICIFNPLDFLESMAWIVGLVILLAGCLRLYFAIRQNRYAPVRATRFFSSVVIILAGALILASPLFTTLAVTVIASLYVLVEGVAMLVQSLQYKRAGFRYWNVLAVIGGLIAVLGCLGTFWPSKLASAAGVVLGIALLLNGVAYFVALAGLAKLDKFDEAVEVE